MYMVVSFLGVQLKSKHLRENFFGPGIWTKCKVSSKKRRSKGPGGQLEDFNSNGIEVD